MCWEINIREYRRDNQKGEIQRNWQHRIHKTNKNTAQYVLDTTICKQIVFEQSHPVLISDCTL
jgi:hypothetical protein